MPETTICTSESGTCQTCRAACVHKPGWFLPGEAEQVAEYLGLTLPELFETKLAVDWWDGGSDGPDIFTLSPAVVDGEPGAEFSANPCGRCVFYVDERRSIHPVKPHECRIWWCEMPVAERNVAHYATALAWTAHQAQITTLLGREPVTNSWSIFDALGRT